MRVDIPINDCYLADETDRYKALIKKDKQREFFKMILAYRDEFQLFDYERPIKFIPKAKKPFFIIRFLRSLLP